MSKIGLKRLSTVIVIACLLLVPFMAAADETETPPKYIFFVIGDGMGETHLEIGRIFTKMMSGDMSEEPGYTDFPVHITADGGADSSQGGTMLATGVTMPSGYISTNREGGALTTILDIAKDNGYKTGMITTASLIDGTPATFLSHATRRSMMKTIARDFADSGVDFIAGGGVERLFSAQSIPQDLKVDASGTKLTTFSTENLSGKLEDAGYQLFLGLLGTQTFFNGGTGSGKTFAAFTGGNFPFYYLQKTAKNAETMNSTPKLEAMVQEAIANLSADEASFLMVVEASAIDDASHQQNAKYIAAEMGVLDKTLDTILRFYADHPDETLIILTADHETGRQTHPLDAVDDLSEKPLPMLWGSDSTTICDTLYENFRASVNKAAVEEGLTNEKNGTFDNAFDNRLIAVSEMTAKVQHALGFRQHTKNHSSQPVPILAIGQGSDAFSTAEGIQDIPHLICDIAGWIDELGTLRSQSIE